MAKSRRIPLALAAVSLALITVPLGVVPAAAQEDLLIVMAGSQNLPPVAPLQSGQRIVWQNLDPLRHNVAPNGTLGSTVGGQFPVTSPLLDQNQTWSCNPSGSYRWTCQKDKDGRARTITLQPGRYAYLCEPHAAWQHGVIVVV